MKNYKVLSCSVKSNLVNLKYLGLEILFPTIESLNDREVDIRIYSPSKRIIIRGVYIKYMFCVSNTSFVGVKETSLREMFLLRTQTHTVHALIDSI